MNKQVKENDYEKPAYSYPILLVITILLIMVTNIDRTNEITDKGNISYNDSITTVETVNYDSTSVYFVNTESE
jgi:hypothetical protein